MTGGNQKDRVEYPLSQVTGPTPGENLFEAFKAEMIKENVFQLMFGTCGERIYTSSHPNLNESILPALLMSWRSETFKSNNVYLDGVVDAWIILPVQLKGNYNALRRVGSIFQRWMSGGMMLFDKIPGLTMFGFGSDYNYAGLATFSGTSAPAIQISLPFRFDLQLMRLQSVFDPAQPLDDSDVGFIESILLEVINGETNEVIVQEGPILGNGSASI
jgi:hypothetical protein